MKFYFHKLVVLWIMYPADKKRVLSYYLEFLITHINPLQVAKIMMRMVTILQSCFRILNSVHQGPLTVLGIVNPTGNEENNSAA